MGETAASNPGLQLSVSFGRFENDSLSWEKWSTFSPNKYLEEVEKCATPGSVAQKKAYFEAHYKKIAAGKAELLSQEKETDKDPLKSEDEDGEDQSGICGADAEFDASDNPNSIEGFKQETHSSGEISRTQVDSFEGDFSASGDYQISSVDGENKQLDECRSNSSQVEKPEEEERPTMEAEDLKESSLELDKEMVKVSEVEAKHVKVEQSKDSKVTTGNKKINTAKAKKKPLLPSSKVAQASTPGSLRSITTPTKTPAFASSTRKGNSPSLSGRQATSTGENKRIANKSLHMSLSLGPSKPDPAPLTSMRKSSIMEKIGDKDIVKRTFKTFQSINLRKTSGEERSLVKKQIPSGLTERRVQKSMPSRIENGRPTKVDGINKISGNAVRVSGGLKSDVRAEKGKEFPKKIEEKSNAKAAERVRLQSKLKGQREIENKKANHNFKATPLPAFYRAQKVSKTRAEKGDINSETPQ
ncbi:protein WVD2-like 7 isoform X2 [Neltuma alba]|nr:protein WVD2-like 7 isoform X2 [Prosopis alba]